MNIRTTWSQLISLRRFAKGFPEPPIGHFQDRALLARTIQTPPPPVVDAISPFAEIRKRRRKLGLGSIPIIWGPPQIVLYHI